MFQRQTQNFSEAWKLNSINININKDYPKETLGIRNEK